jgi:hypothetical protein
MIDDKETGAERRRRAGAANLARWRATDPAGRAPHLKHGVYSPTVRKRYSDLRTTEGQRLKAVIDTLVADLGGPENVNNAQQVILAALKSKLSVIYQISAWVDKQPSIINPEGHLLDVLGRNFLSFCESARRDLEVLFAINRRGKGAKIPTIEEVIARSKECAS